MKNVTIYTTSACVYCRMTKEFLDQKNIVYTEKNVATDQAAAQEMIDKSGQMGVPVTIVSDEGKEEMIIGFDEEQLRSILDIA